MNCEKCQNEGYYYLPLSAFENNRYFCECPIGRARQKRILRQRLWRGILNHFIVIVGFIVVLLVFMAAMVRCDGIGI